ncbi:MAG: membrane protein insertase YidC, partial [Nitrospirae bacterium]|nr:membrane protein insertase YidC [Nitrospirota bacterium]
MDKRTLIAVVLAIVVLIGYQYLSALFQPQQLTPPPPAKDTVAGSVKKEPPPAATVPPVVEEPSQARNVTVETGLYSATLSSKGGTVRKFTLKTYKDKTGTGVSLLQAPGMYPPLALGEKEDFGLSNVNFSLKGADLNLKGSESGTVTFEYATPQFSVRRTFTFYGDRYKIDLKDDVQGLPEYWVTLGSNFGIYDAKDESAPHIGPVVLKDADRIELVTKKLDEPKVYKEGLKWIAQEDKYFFASIVPSGQVLEAKVWKVQDSPVVALKVKPGVSTYIVYAGPKDYDRLQELKVGLEHIVDFGFFSILARPLFWILKFFYRFMGNYGWAIVLLTIIVRIPFIPLLNKSQKSMKKMQEIQPKL